MCDAGSGVEPAAAPDSGLGSGWKLQRARDHLAAAAVKPCMPWHQDPNWTRQCPAQTSAAHAGIAAWEGKYNYLTSPLSAGFLPVYGAGALGPVPALPCRAATSRPRSASLLPLLLSPSALACTCK